MTGCLHMWKNFFRGNNLNRKTISTLLSLPLYIVWARMNTELQFIKGKACGQCWWLHWVEDTCVNIQEYLQCYLVFFITIKSNAELMKWPTYVCTYDCMYVCECARVYACTLINVCVYIRMYLRSSTWFFSDPQSSLPSAKSRRGRMLRYISF